MNIPSLLADSPSMGRRDLDTQQAATPALGLDYTDASASEYQRLYIPQEYTSGPGSSRNLPSIRTPAIKTTAPEPQVKLTPITGKISKAKKGMPVHTCDQCPKVSQLPGLFLPTNLIVTTITDIHSTGTPAVCLACSKL
ncbi:hypothetical protein BKA56DRAFT_82854 [Ilyonectria sp. MPI-CAGE-AT-0026]|nr:hypothetical protein BKA56DRAFT_82854 [Ilyonectria sp. MPI-CAGE-AT-0026]